jgi:murein DD-endopeptidase MepM/ murein hydrolase activator NlpD
MKAVFWLSIFSFLVVSSAAAQGIQVTWSPREVKQGDVLAVRVQADAAGTVVEGSFDKTPLYFYKDDETSFGAIVGVDMAAAPGEHTIRVVLKGRGAKPRELVFPVLVAAGSFEVQHLTLTKALVDLQGEILKRYLAERKKITAIFNHVSPVKLWEFPFVRPVAGEITSTFGLRRILNGQERSPHNGVDIGAPQGTEVLACNNGVVALARELCLEGNTIIIDHGLGLYSIYMHLSEIRVKEGETVARGAGIGLVGATGRVTGPHLHWGVKLSGARVDPFALVRLGTPAGQ